MGASVGGLGAAAANAANSQPGQNNFDNSWLSSQYQNLLGRAPDAEGYNYWNSQLQSGNMSQQDITNAFMQTPEYMNRANQAQPTFNAKELFNQGYSGGQIAAMAQQQGLSQDELVRQTGLSPEVVRQAYAGAGAYQDGVGTADRNVAGSTGYADPNNIQGFVNSLYAGYLNRAADQGGLDYWVNQIQSGAKTKEQVEQEFKQTPEYQQLNAPKPTTPAPQPFGITTKNPFSSSQNPYIQAAQQNALGNLAGAQTATAANRVNQNTPFGSLQFTQSGVDAAGNPIWSANQQLATGLQPAFNNIQQNVAQQTARPFDVSATQQQIANIQSPEFQRIGERPDLIRDVEGTGMEGWDRANELMMSRLAPRMQQLDEALDAKLANRGIMPGTEAYNRAKLTLNQANNDLTVQAQLAGAQLQNQQFQQNLAKARFGNEARTGENTMGLANLAFNNQLGQQGFANQMAALQASNQARQSNFQQNLAAYNNPLQQLAAFREGTNPAYVNYFNQATTGGPDYFGAYTTANAADIAAQNAANARTANMQAGLFGLGSAALLGGGGVGGLFNLGKSAIEGIGQGYDWLSGQFGGGGNVVSNIPSVTPSDYSRWFSGSDVLDDFIF